VLLGSTAALRDPSATLLLPWAETTVAAVADTAIGPVEVHCLHVPNAANGWVKAHTLQAVRAGLQIAPRMARVVCGDLNTPPRELESGEVVSFARDSRGRLRPERGPEWDDLRPRLA
jgi:endonuclease/exonuclease/phosphatase family metal-dependent hydrolase